MLCVLMLKLKALVGPIPADSRRTDSFCSVLVLLASLKIGQLELEFARLTVLSVFWMCWEYDNIEV